MEPGRLCVKVAGRESGRICVVIKRIDDNFVLIDGFVKRRRCNIKHLEPLPYKIEVSESDTKEVIQKKILEVTKGAKELRELERVT